MDYYRPARERGEASHGWLRSRHSFSFAEYYDPAHMGFGVLRVINDDWVAPGAGFGSHPHRDMEIISYILEGAIEHRDNMGHVSRLEAGQVQRMSAGTGVVHSEYNASGSDPLRFLQIWIKPDQRGIAPGYQDMPVAVDGKLTALVTPDGRDDTLSINQDMSLYKITLAPGEQLVMPSSSRAAYLHGITGDTMLEDRFVGEGDGAGLVSVPAAVELVGGNGGFEGLWFDLPPLARH